MDAVVALCVAVFILVFKKQDKSLTIDETENIQLKVKLNENFKHDDDAFMEVAHGLGFRNNNDTV